MRNITPVILFFLFTSLFTNLYGQAFENGIPWLMPWNDTVYSDFMPAFPADPIGEDDRVTTDGSGDFIVHGETYRFFGGNLTTEGAFPTKETAPLVAGRMRKYGLNLIRFHHIDNPWSDASLFYGQDGTRTLNAGLLDRLDYILWQLKENGVYVNMNLNVSRTFKDSDGVYAADSLRDYAKGVTQFDPYMMKLQKEYARDLLGHTNPYTGISLAADPALAMVEIINENTLFRMWYGDDLQPINKGGNLPTYYSVMLDSLWMDFLEEKYVNTAGLEAAWNGAEVRGDTLFQDDFEEGMSDRWEMEIQGTIQATATITDDAASGNAAVKVDVTQTSTESWHFKFKIPDLSMEKDSVYELHFKAKSDVPRSLPVSFQNNVSPWTWYAGQPFQLTTEYQDYTLTFKAPENLEGTLRIAFGDNSLGNFYLDDVVWKGQSLNGLAADESLEARNIRRNPYSEYLLTASARMIDLTDFYTRLQLDFLSEMKIFLTDTLGVTAPITGSNWFTGPEMIYAQKEMDFIDNHSYWDHPQFPNTSWDPYDWKINNTSMLKASSPTIVNHFAGSMVKDKPFTISEYNHAFPNQYQAELFPVITSYMSFNDADALMMFTYSGSWDWDSEVVDNFFDIHRNPVLMSNFPLFSYAFRKHMIRESEEVFTVDYSYKDILEMPRNKENTWSYHLPYSKDYAYNTRMELTFDNPDDFDPLTLPAIATSPYALNDEEIYWDTEGLFKISTPGFASITGYLENFEGASTDMMTLVNGSDFAGIHWLSLTDSALDASERSILNIGTRIMNENMIWDGTTTVHTDWGTSPVQVFPGDITVKLKTNYAYLQVSRLDEICRVDSSVSYVLKTAEDGYATFRIDMLRDSTLWYGIEGLEHSPYDTLYCMPVSIAPSVDGMVDPLWEDIEAYSLGRLVSGSIMDEADLSVSVKAVFSYDSLFFLAEVRDDVLSLNSDNHWERDNIELFFDMDNNDAYEDGEGQKRWVWSSSNPDAPGVSSQQDMEGGWRLEIAIPFKDLDSDFRLQDGLCIGFDMAASDNDSDHREAILGWHDGTGSAYLDASLLGELVFMHIPEVEMSDDGELMEGFIDGEVLTVKLENYTFADPLSPASWELVNLPDGVHIASLDRMDEKTVHLTLGGEPTVALTEAVELSLEIAPTEFATQPMLKARSSGGATLLVYVEPDPVEFPLDFESESARYEWNDFSGAIASIIPNPNPSGINTSATVVKIVKGEGDDWAGNWIALDEPIDFSSLRGIKMKVMGRKIGASVTLKVENLDDAGIVHEAVSYTTDPGKWEELLFDFSTVDQSREYQKLVIIFEIGTVGTGSASFTYYVDDIDLAEEPSHDASLSALLIDGVALQGFDKALFNYDQELPEDAALPVLSATTTDANASMVITDVTEIPGTGTVVVVAQDGHNSSSYSVDFSYEVAVPGTGMQSVKVFAHEGLLHLICDESLLYGSIEVFDLTGTSLYKKEIYSNSQNFSLEHRGIYLVRIVDVNGNQVLTRKVLIQ